MIYKTLNNPENFSNHIYPLGSPSMRSEPNWFLLCSSSIWYFDPHWSILYLTRSSQSFVFQWVTKLAKIFWDSAAHPAPFSSHLTYAYFPVEKNSMRRVSPRRTFSWVFYTSALARMTDQFYTKYGWENESMDLHLVIHLILKWTLLAHQKVTNHFENHCSKKPGQLSPPAFVHESNCL